METNIKKIEEPGNMANTIIALQEELAALKANAADSEELQKAKEELESMRKEKNDWKKKFDESDYEL